MAVTITSHDFMYIYVICLDNWDRLCLCEVRAEAEETVEPQTSRIIDCKRLISTSKDTDCKSPCSRYLEGGGF
jgi:hypothetical protein